MYNEYVFIYTMTISQKYQALYHHEVDRHMVRDIQKNIFI